MKYSYKVSIVIPVYNAEKYLDECLRSLLSQTMDSNEFEIVLVNDGSKDSSGEICKKWSTKYPNISYYEKENEGVSATRNLGIKKAKGKYILFLDTDDYLSRNALQDITAFFDTHYDEIDLITYPTVLVYQNGRKRMHNRYKNDFSKQNEIYDLNENYRLVQATINVCIKNNKDYLFDTKQFYSEDEQFNTKILMDKKKMGYVPSAIYYYRQHENSVTAKKNNYDLEEIYKFHREFQKKYNNHPYIQGIIINNLSWRIHQDCLAPKNIPIDNINNYIKPITERLSEIDFSLFKEYLQENLLLELLALSPQKIETRIEKNGLYSINDNKNIIATDFISHNDICQLNLKDNILKIKGSITTALFHDHKIKLVGILTFADGTIKNKEIDLYALLEYQKKYRQIYEFNIDIRTVKKLEFKLLLDEKLEIPVQTKANDWCSKYKVIYQYQIKILDGIFIKRKSLFCGLRNKFRNNHNIQFQLLNLLSCFYFSGRKTYLYFGDKESDIYSKYLKDNHKKIFRSSTSGIKYKLLLLSCDRIVTNKPISEVIPFGNMQRCYVQASKFLIDNE